MQRWYIFGVDVFCGGVIYIKGNLVVWEYEDWYRQKVKFWNFIGGKFWKLYLFGSKYCRRYEKNNLVDCQM